MQCCNRLKTRGRVSPHLSTSSGGFLLALPRFAFGGQKTWMEWTKTLRSIARGEGRGSEFQEAEENLKTGEVKVDRIHRFWHLVREFWPEDYPKIAADAMIYNLKVPGIQNAPHPLAISQDGPAEPEAESEGEAPKEFRAKKSPGLDFSRWDDKKRDSNAGWDWVYDNYKNPNVDPYSAPNAGDFGFLQDIRTNPSLRQKFFSDYVNRSMAKNTESEERRGRVNDTAEDLMEVYSDIQNRVAEAPETIQNQIMGYARSAEASHA